MVQELLQRSRKMQHGRHSFNKVQFMLHRTCATGDIGLHVLCVMRSICWSPLMAIVLPLTMTIRTIREVLPAGLQGALLHDLCIDDNATHLPSCGIKISTSSQPRHSTNER